MHVCVCVFVHGCGHFLLQNIGKSSFVFRLFWNQLKWFSYDSICIDCSMVKLSSEWRCASINDIITHIISASVWIIEHFMWPPIRSTNRFNVNQFGFYDALGQKLFDCTTPCVAMQFHCTCFVIANPINKTICLSAQISSNSLCKSNFDSWNGKVVNNRTVSKICLHFFTSIRVLLVCFNKQMYFFPIHLFFMFRQSEIY